MDKLKLLQEYFTPKGITFGMMSGYGWWYAQNGLRQNISLQGFPVNCGVRVMTGFIPTNFNEDAALGLIEYVKYINKGVVGAMIYTINASQLKFVPALLRAGFTEFFDGYNPGHGDKHVIKGYVFDFKNYKKTVDQDEVFKL